LPPHGGAHAAIITGLSSDPPPSLDLKEKRCTINLLGKAREDRGRDEWVVPQPTHHGLAAEHGRASDVRK
jgi:hypothetical protein